jgi:hypothetical protein
MPVKVRAHAPTYTKYHKPKRKDSRPARRVAKRKAQLRRLA